MTSLSKTLLDIFGLSSSSISPLCRYFSSYQDLLDDVKSIIPKIIIVPDIMVTEEKVRSIWCVKETLESLVAPI